MILYTVKLKIKTPILGMLRIPGNDCRTLQRNDAGRVVIPQQHWYWGVREALATTRMDQHVSSDCFRDLIPYVSPATHAYERKSPKRSERFEAVRSGVVITTQLLISDISPDEKCRPIAVRLRPPDKDDIESVLKYTGAFIGITQWGYKFGYGRFSLLEVTEATKDEINDAITQVVYTAK